MLRTCTDCPTVFKGNSKRCPECRSIHKDREKKRWQVQQQRKRCLAAGGPWPCEICHKDLVWRRNGKYCEGCREKTTKYERRTPAPVKTNALPPDTTTHERDALRRFEARQAKQAVLDANKMPFRASTLAAAETFSKTSTQTALNRENALTGHCGAVSHGHRQASAGGGE